MIERSSFQDRRALVLGLGRFAGGVETTRFLTGEGATVVVSDAAPRALLEAPAAEAEALGATLHFGAQTPALLDGIDVVVASPAMPFDHPVLEAARAQSIPITTEMNIVLARCRAPVFGVTGTKGKSTTATLLANMLEAAGHTVHLGGNIGRPLVAQVDRIPPEARLVLELSSFQLWWTRSIGISPHLTLVTNLFPDHLDRHGAMEAYAEAKRAALDFQTPDDVAVLPADDDAVRAAGWLEAGDARRVFYGTDDLDVADNRLHWTSPTEREVRLTGWRLLGPHNLRNALAAAVAASQADLSTPDSVRRGAMATEPLPHRLEPVAEVDGVLYVDDSNATNPRSTVAALEALDRPVVLLLGGKDKGTDPAALLRRVAQRAKAVVGLGTTGPALVRAVRDALAACESADMPSAVRSARELAVPGDVVLLSPGYSSLDEYVSFAERGAEFRKAIEDLTSGRARG